jgi:hypothetical protein
MEKNNNMGTGFKRGSKSRPLIIVANNKQSKIVFEGTRKQHQKFLEEAKFRRGTIHHVYTDRGGEDVSYFRATKK